MTVAREVCVELLLQHEAARLEYPASPKLGLAGPHVRISVGRVVECAARAVLFWFETGWLMDSNFNTKSMAPPPRDPSYPPTQTLASCISYSNGSGIPASNRVKIAWGKGNRITNFPFAARWRRTELTFLHIQTLLRAKLGFWPTSTISWGFRQRRLAHNLGLQLWI